MKDKKFTEYIETLGELDYLISEMRRVENELNCLSAIMKCSWKELPEKVRRLVEAVERNEKEKEALLHLLSRGPYECVQAGEADSAVGGIS